MENQLENLPQLVSKHESEGQHELAVQLCKETLRGLKEAKGNAHSDVAKVFKILEQVYRNQISYSERNFGPNNGKVSVTLTKLGDVYYELNKFGDAESVYLQALKIAEKIYKENDPKIEKLLWRLASAYRHQDKYDEAEFYFKNSLKICERIGGQLEKAKRTLDLGNLYMQKCDLKAAEELYHEVMKVFDSELSPRDLLVGHTKYNLGKCLAKQGRFQEAEKYFKEASIIYQSKEEDLHVADSHLGLGCCFLDQSKYEESTKYLQSSLTLLIKPPLDPKDIKVADVYFNLGWCFSGLKRNKKAESAYSHAINIYKGTLGENNLQIAEPMFNLANCLMARGQHQKAEEYLLRLLTLHKKNPTIGKLKTVDTKCCLIKCLMKQGRCQEANEHLNEGSIFEQETLHLATIKFNLGNCYLDAENYLESISLYHEALRIFEKQEKRNDLMVADIKYNLAQSLTQLNRIKEAEGLYLESLTLYTKELKPNDPHLCNVKINLGNCYLILKEWENARVYFTMVLEIYKSALGFDDLDVAEAKKNVALCFYKQKCIKEALCYFKEAKILFNENSQTDDKIIFDFLEKKSSWWFKQERVKYFLTDLFPPCSLKSAKNKTILGDCYFEHEKFAEAVKCYRECLKFYKSLPGDVNWDIARESGNLGRSLMRQGMYKVAENLLKEALEIYEKHFKDHDSNIADMKDNIALCLYNQGNSFGAVEYLESACVNYKERPICLDLAGAKHQIGCGYLSLNKLDKAEQSYREALKLYRSHSGDTKVFVASTLTDMSDCLKKQGKHKDAEESTREALEILRKHLDETHEFKLAFVKEKIGMCLSGQGNSIEAVEYLEAACIIYEKERPFSLDVIIIKYNIGNEYSKLEKWDVAEKWYKESLKLYRSREGDMNLHITRVLSDLGECLRKQGKHKEAEELMSKYSE